MPERTLGLEMLSHLTLISGFSHCALFARRKPFNAGFSIDMAANLSAHSALACDGGRNIAGPANSNSPSCSPGLYGHAGTERIAKEPNPARRAVVAPKPIEPRHGGLNGPVEMTLCFVDEQVSLIGQAPDLVRLSPKKAGY